MQTTYFSQKTLNSNYSEISTEKKSSGLFFWLNRLNNHELGVKIGYLYHLKQLKLVSKELQNLFFSILTCEVFHSLFQEVKST